MDIMVISKYNYANFPFSADGLAQTDGTALTSATSHGATVANFGTTLSKKYTESLEDTKYLSADGMIDASTCVLPETTWFVKNLIHDKFPASVNKLIEAFITSDEMTVFTNEDYPQYLKYDNSTGELSVVDGADAGDVIVRNTWWTKLRSFLKFFDLILNFIMNLFGGSSAEEV